MDTSNPRYSKNIAMNMDVYGLYKLHENNKPYTIEGDSSKYMLNFEFCLNFFLLLMFAQLAFVYIKSSLT